MGRVSRWTSEAGLALIRIALAVVGVCCALSAQEMMPAADGIAHPLYTDMAVLEAQETRKEIPCDVEPVKPSLGFDLKFHAGYLVTVPLKELSGNGNQLTMVFRIVPAAKSDDPVYMWQHIPVPEIEADARGEAFLDGSYDIGEGKYHVSWLMRDRTERVCSSNWDVDASLSAREKGIPLEIASGDVQAADRELFKSEPAPERGGGDAPLYIKVLVNFAPPDSSSAAMQPADRESMIAILRNIARDSRITRFSLVAFDIREERVVFRQKGDDQIDFPALGEAFESLVFGTVRLHQLVAKHSASEFLGGLLLEELGNTRDQPDAVVIAGPRLTDDDPVPQEYLKQLGELRFPVFYLNYVPNPSDTPWRDSIEGAVRYLKGVDYTISKPRDMYSAWGEIMGRVVKSKVGKVATGGASSQ